ncbi:MAG: hypothetical protein IJE01_06365 [Clostridia bacterium]|nr:hypothetical protein [Clostridia bacterium]
MKLDPTVKKETQYISLWVVIFSLITQSVFLIAGIWDYTVLLGNILSGIAAIGNFLLMGITVQKAVLKEEKEAKSLIKASQKLRTLALLVVAVIGLLLPMVFNIWAVLIPLLFPRIAIALRPLFLKEK